MLTFYFLAPAREFANGEAASENRINGVAAKTNALKRETPLPRQTITKATSTLSGISKFRFSVM